MGRYEVYNGFANIGRRFDTHETRKGTLTRYAVLLLGAAILSFGLFNVHSQSGVTEGGVLGTTLLLHHWFGISPGVSEFVIDGICYALGFSFLGKAFFKYAIAASAGFACFISVL